MNAREIKRLGKIWGGQHGLLSVSELDLLMRLVRDEPADALRVLEVGHYLGLSTCGLVHALRERGGDWRLTTVDAHIADSRVGATNPKDFERNRQAHFDDPRLEVRFELSQTLTAPLDYDVVFYDGDHDDEQIRFTHAVVESPRVRLFVYDDSDFATPRALKGALAWNWTDCSPELQRLPGDKTNPETQTLGVFRR